MENNIKLRNMTGVYLSGMNQPRRITFVPRAFIRQQALRRICRTRAQAFI